MSMVLSIGSTSPVTGETQTTFLMTNRNNETEEKMEFFSLLSAYLARDGTQKVSEIIQEPVKTRGEPPQEKRETRESNAAPVPKPVSIKGKKANEEEAPQNTGLEKAGSAVTKKEAMKSGTSYVLTNNRDIISNNEEKSQEKVIIKNGEEIVLKNVNKQEKKKVIKDKITLPIEAAELKIPKGREAQIESGVKEKKQEYPTGEPDKDPLVGEVIQEPVKTREEPPQELREIREIRENSTTQSPKPVSIKGKKANEEEASQNTDLEKAGSAVTKKEAIITDQGLVFTNSVIINNNEEKSQEEVIKKNGEEIVLKNVNKQEEKKVIKDKITLPIEPAEFKIPERREAQIEFEIKEKKQEYPRENSDRDPLIGETKKEPVKTGGEPPQEIREIREKRESNTAPVPKPVSIKGKKVVEEEAPQNTDLEKAGSAVTKKEAMKSGTSYVLTNNRDIIRNNKEKAQEEVIKKNGEEIVLKNVNKQEEKKVIKDKITLPIEPAEFKIPERREAQIEFEIKEKKQEYPRGNSDRDPLIGETKKEPVKTGGEPPREIREIREKRESNTAPVPKPVSIKGKKVVEEVMHNSPNFETTGIPGKEKEVEISLKTEDKSVIKNMLSTPLELIESKIRGTPIKDNKQGFIIGNPVGDNDAEIETNGKHSGQIPETLKTPIIKQVATGQKFVLASNSVFYKRSEAEVTSYGQKHKYASFEIENISHDNGEIMHFDMKYSGCKSEDADNVKEQNGRNGSRENETSFETGRLSLGQEVSSNLSGDINESIEKTAVKQLPAKTINFINSTLSNQKPRVLQLQMEPEHLGRVKVTLNWTKGNLSARFYTENVEAAHAVQKSLEVLKQNLDALNINVTNLAVSCFDQSGKDPLYSGMRQIFGDKRSRTRQNDTGLSFPGKKSNSYVGTGSHAVNFLV